MANERPEGVPEDYVLVDCDNPKCDYTVWIPPDIGVEVDGTPLVRVCSAECARAILESLG